MPPPVRPHVVEVRPRVGDDRPAGVCGRVQPGVAVDAAEGAVGGAAAQTAAAVQPPAAADVGLLLLLLSPGVGGGIVSVVSGPLAVGAVVALVGISGVGVAGVVVPVVASAVVVVWVSVERKASFEGDRSGDREREQKEKEN